MLPARYPIMRLTALPPMKRCTGAERSPGGLHTARKRPSSNTTYRGSLSATSRMLRGARSSRRSTLVNWCMRAGVRAHVSDGSYCGGHTASQWH